MKKLFPLLAFCALAAIAHADDLPPLNDPATTDFFPGKFVWSELMTADLRASQTFYTQLLGWNASTIQRPTSEGLKPYVVFTVGDRPVAGARAWPSKMAGSGHARWLGYVSVPDVDKALAVAEANGGKVALPGKHKSGLGTTGVLQDQQGAYLGLIHSDSGDPGEYLADPGDWTWAEAFSTDSARAARFYAAVIGYSIIPDSRPGEETHTILASGGFSRASLIPTSKPDSHQVWLQLVRVMDVKATVEKAQALGAKIVSPPADKVGRRWRAVIIDPSGAYIGLVQLEKNDLGPAK